MKSVVVLMALVASGPAIATGGAYEKNNLPCVAELCIGDGLAELRGIPWQRAQGPFSIGGQPNYADARPLSASRTKEVIQGLHGNVIPAAPYLNVASFDAKVLPLLAGVTAACGRIKLVGRYSSEGGNPTTVRIELVPDEDDAAVQRWTVVSIERDFPQAVSRQQQLEVKNELVARYGRFKLRGRRDDRTAFFDLGQGPFSAAPGLRLWLSPGVKASGNYVLHPACGGARKVTVD